MTVEGRDRREMTVREGGEEKEKKKKGKKETRE